MKILTITTILFTLYSCATSYVLHSAKKPCFLFCSHKEVSSIASQNNVTILYARDPIVIIEPIEKDGSVIVHYTLSVKNNRKEAIQVELDNLTLISSIEPPIKAYYQKNKKVKKSLTIPAGYRFDVAIAFKLTAKIIKKYQDSEEALFMNVPVKNSKAIQLKVWLWEI